VPAFRLATYTWAGFAPLFLARDLGYFGGEKIQLIELPSATECLLAFQNRVVDAITLTVEEVIRLAQPGHEPRIVLMLDYSNGADVLMAKPNIPGVMDLKGRAVGVESNSVGAFFLARALETCGLTFEDIKLASHRADWLELEFASGRLDAVVTHDPFRARMLAAGARSIFDSSKLPNEIVDALIVRREMLENPHAALRALPEAWFRAVEYVKAQPIDAARRMAPRHQVSPDAFLESLRGLQLLGRMQNRNLLATGSPLPAALQRLSTFLAKSELIAAPVDTASLADGRLILANQG
jgi:NitT/TauT family transport system substrate-binding protein